MTMPEPHWWRNSERADLAMLERALRRGCVAQDTKAAIFAAIRKRADEKGGRFARAVDRLVAEFGEAA